MRIVRNGNSGSRLAEKIFSFSGCDVAECSFGFCHCAVIPQEPQITIPSDSSDQSAYTVIAEAVRDFRGWITVTANAVIRNAVRTYRRIVCEAKALFNRRTFIRQGGLRL